MPSPYASPTFGSALSLRVDGAIGAMSLAPNGRDAVLAGRKGLFIIDLDDPFTAPRWLHHITSWEVADVQWLPHPSKPSWCVSTLNQKALLWDLARPSHNAIQNVLHRHTRAITDIHFHPQDAEMLATCLIDTFVFAWDMRAPRRPVHKWAEWRAGATQVKWSQNNAHLLALSHHHSFCLWDARKGALPLLKVDGAHTGKINGLDFGGRLVTCANDATVKFWDVETSLEMAAKTPTLVINTDYPVARARRLPFGQDHCCGLMPVRGGGNAIHIVNYKTEYERAKLLGETVHMDAVPDYSFRGHLGPIKDFLWRTQHANYEGFSSNRSWAEYQMVTWSPLDYELRLWPHERKLYDIANYNPLHQVLLGLLMPDLLPIGTPETEMSEEALMRHAPLRYSSFIDEPDTQFADFAKDLRGDLLLKLARYTIKKSQKNEGFSQLNHLSWISGVRMGRQLQSKAGNGPEQVQGPANLGEEISIVGHKFSKLRFERISVSTGHIEISLRGPLPYEEKAEEQIARNDLTKRDSVPEVLMAPSVSNNSVSGVSPNANVSQNVTQTGVRQNTSLPAVNAIKQDMNASFTDPQPEKLVFIRLTVKFPLQYPFLDPGDSRSLRKHAKRASRIRFDIEETHELTSAVKHEMLRNLDEISFFYANKHHRHCLEPCLRYLMGEKIDLDDALMMDNPEAEDLHDDEISMEIGNENWVDDLIDQHEAAAAYTPEVALSGDEDDEDADLIFGNNDKLALSVELTRQAEAAEKAEIQAGHRVKNDSTPLPKGCGAVWTRTGELVCFFIPKTGDGESNNARPEIFKFAETGFGLRSPGGNSNAGSEKARRQSDPQTAATLHTNVYVPPELEIESDCDINADSESDTSSLASSNSSNDSFSNDWDEMVQDDMPSRQRMPGIFRGTVALTTRLRIDEINGNSLSRTLDGKGSAYKSSVHDDSGSKLTRKAKKGRRGHSVVSILDFKHLVPDKYELACEYRVLGDSPEVLARHNSEVALQHGYGEIGRVWRIVETVLVKKIRAHDPTDFEKDVIGANGGGDFFWGHHPMGHAWLVSELFLYFEKKRDLQMLAMLSCLLYENPATVLERDPSIMDAPVNTPYPSLPPRPSLVSMRETSLLLSEEAIAGSESVRSLATERHRILSRKPSVLSTREFQLSRPISASPDFIHSSESPSQTSSLRHTTAAPFQLGSPPLLDSYAQSASIERNARSFENSKMFSRVAANNRRGSKGVQQRIRGSTNLQHSKARPPPLYTIEIKNAALLDLYEDRFSAPLLSGIDPEKLLKYREQYAEMLYTWGLPLHRIKMLKFNFPPEHLVEEKTHDDVHKCSYGSRHRKAFKTQQLLLTPITPIPTARDNAWNTRKRNALHYCGYCGLIVSKRVVICTKCEHIVHPHCAAEWWAQDDFGDTIAECPTGCGCACLVGETTL
ncbi:WD40 repeat [Metschnikowia aff. pulcherrima]|uniref:WD40 repeat n=1 Tax=Metschnikowia aff. pulcherrima TaxID=2163413 RepID=A0A4V1AEA3_9ASCO|nr:WD40 repeat [Metschnikowia aff. pulcherrima]